MKYYNTDIKQNEIYVLDFKEDKSKLKVELLDGEIWELENNKINKDKIINIMTEQSKKAVKESYLYITSYIMVLLGFALSATAGVVFVEEAIKLGTLTLGSFVFSLSTIISLGLLKNRKNKLNELNKLKFLLQNKEDLDKILEEKMENKNILNNTKSKTIKKINQMEEKEETFNPKNIMNYKISELEKLKRNRELLTNYDFVYTGEEKVLKKVKKS